MTAATATVENNMMLFVALMFMVIIIMQIDHGHHVMVMVMVMLMGDSSAVALGTALDGQTNSVKKNRIRLSIVNLSAIAGLERRSTARQIQSKRTEFFCPSSTRPKRTEFVCQSTTSAGRSSELQEQRMATHTKSNIHINRWDNCILLNATTPIIATHLFY